MAEAQAATEQKPDASTTQQSADTQKQEAPTLEQVYKDYNVDAMAQEFSAKPQQKQERQEQQTQREEQISVPDPVLDRAGYDKFMASYAKKTANTEQALHRLSNELQAERRARALEVEEADIRKAVSKVNEHLGDAKLPDDFLEVALGVEAKKDKRFLTIWENRSKNPQAFEAALKAVAGKLGKTYALRADPQIAENQRALREATSTKASTAPEPSMDEKLGKLQGAAFLRAMDDIKNGRTPRV